ncbi:hypothetical protein [Thermoleptolyngbya sp.]
MRLDCSVTLRITKGVSFVRDGIEQNRGYPRLKPTARYREQRSKAGQDSGQMSGFNARESAN